MSQGFLKINTENTQAYFLLDPKQRENSRFPCPCPPPFRGLNRNFDQNTIAVASNALLLIPIFILLQENVSAVR